jgi:hypothetical protein
MALKDNLLFGIHVGLVVESNDPDNLGRVKLVVPGKIGFLYSGWNDLEDDITFSSVTPDFFSEEKLLRLKRILPWARPAMPLWGGGTGSFNETTTGVPYVNPPETAYGGTGSATRPTGSAPTAIGNYPFATNTQYLQNTRPRTGNIWGIVFHDTSGTQPAAGAGKYNYVVAQDGTVYEMIPPDQHPSGAVNYNTNFIQIAATGFEGNPLSPAQSASMTQLTNFLSSKYNLSSNNFFTHADIDSRTNGGKDIFGLGPASRGGKDTREASWLGDLKSRLGANPDTRIARDDGTNNINAGFSQVDAVGSGSTSANCVDATGLSLSQSRANSYGLNQAMDATNTQINVVNGVMDEASAKAYFVKRLQNSPLLCANIDSAEARSYGINDTRDPNAWADFIWRTALAEQGGKVTATGYDVENDPNGSYGAFSNSASGYYGSAFSGASPNDLSKAGDAYKYAGYTDVTRDILQSNPQISSNVVISLLERQIGKNNRISDIDNRNGGSFARTTTAKLRGESGKLTAATSGRQLVQRITNQGVNAYGSINMSRIGSPVGTFATPMVGSKVWVMFEGGSPQRPVYVAQAFDPSNSRSIN